MSQADKIFCVHYRYKWYFYFHDIFLNNFIPHQCLYLIWYCEVICIKRIIIQKISEFSKVHKLVHKLLTLNLSKLSESTSYQGTYY